MLTTVTVPASLGILAGALGTGGLARKRMRNASERAAAELQAARTWADVMQQSNVHMANELATEQCLANTYMCTDPDAINPEALGLVDMDGVQTEHFIAVQDAVTAAQRETLAGEVVRRTDIEEKLNRTFESHPAKNVYDAYMAKAGQDYDAAEQARRDASERVSDQTTRGYTEAHEYRV